LLTNLEEKDVLFIDDPPPQYDGRRNPLPGDGRLPTRHHDRPAPSAKTIKLDLPRFTLVGATTRVGLPAPARDRFGVGAADFYSGDEPATIVKRSAKILEIPITQEGAVEPQRARGTPCIVNRREGRLRLRPGQGGAGLTIRSPKRP
jgi:Holliday junction DNA helicase RuvB